MISQCCVCHRIETESDWEEADGIIYDASHTYCPECALVARAEIRAFNRACHEMKPRHPRTGRLRALLKPPFYHETKAESLG